MGIFIASLLPELGFRYRRVAETDFPRISREAWRYSQGLTMFSTGYVIAHIARAQRPLYLRTRLLSRPNSISSAP